MLPGCYEPHNAVCRSGQLDALAVRLRLRALLLQSRKQHLSFSRAGSGSRCRGCAKRSSRMPHACALGVLGARPPGCSGCSSGARVALAWRTLRLTPHCAAALALPGSAWGVGHALPHVLCIYC